MSKIGKQPISVPKGVEVTINQGSIKIKGPKGEISQVLDRDIKVEYKDSIITVTRPTDSIRHKSLHGLYRVLINNMVIGVHKGFTKTLELEGVGYKVSHQGQLLDIIAGFSHNIIFEIPKEVKVNTVTKKGQRPKIELESYDKQLLGEVAANIRAIRKPEPYQGKGIRYSDEIIRKKAGKSATAK